MKPKRDFIRKAAFSISIILLSISLVFVVASGIGLSGPEQDFHVQPGDGLSSHLIVWNEGGSEEEYEAWVTGDISQLLSVDPMTFTLSPGQGVTLSLEYSVQSGQAQGTYEGRLQVAVKGNGISPSISRDLVLAVTTGTTSRMDLQAGINLVTWRGPSGSFGDLIPSDSGLFKIWKRTQDGSYTQAQYYSEQDLWWSTDDGFTGIETGEAYFFETDRECTLDIEELPPADNIGLNEGLNLVGWSHDSASFQDAFPQSPDDNYVDKIWRKESDGSYSFAQYYQEEDQWWSSTPDFQGLETGRAYFVEANRGVELTP